MEWSDHGIVLSARKHGETAAILSVLTSEHGRHAGLVRGGAGRRQRGVLQQGNFVAVTWRARLEEHLGAFTVEMLHSISAQWLDDPGRLAALSAATAIVDFAVPEREPDVNIYRGLRTLIAALDEDDWGVAYARWEFALLGELGFGLDLSACAATGQTDDLAYVSPKTGRAVSRAAGQVYHDKLLPLPGFLLDDGPETTDEVAEGLRLTGYFLDRRLFAPHQRQLPDARERLAARLARAASAERS
jgi:DNA repair protein RecO (recombination protein O)